MLMYGCGLRRSATANGRIQHFNVDPGRLAVPFGKGGTSRTVPLPHQIHADIMQQFEKVRDHHPFRFMGGRHSGPPAATGC
jgi:integrase